MGGAFSVCFNCEFSLLPRLPPLLAGLSSRLDAAWQFLLPLPCFPPGFPGTGVWEEPEQGHHRLHVKEPFVSQLSAGVRRFMGYLYKAGLEILDRCQPRMVVDSNESVRHHGSLIKIEIL